MIRHEFPHVSFRAALLAIGGVLATLPSAALADLDFSCAIAVTQVKDKAHFVITVTNHGTDVFQGPGTIPVSLYRSWPATPTVGDTPDALFDTLSALGPGASKELVADAAVPAGDHTAYCWVNPDIQGTPALSNITEPNWVNNRASANYTIKAIADAPDVIVTGLTPATTDGLSFTFSATATNVGTQPVGAFNVDVYPSSAVSPDFTTQSPYYCVFSGLKVDEEKTVACTGTFTYPTAGAYSAWAFADVDLALTTEVERGNNAFGPITVDAGPADLVVVSYNAKTNISHVDYVATVKNTGAVASKPFDACFWYDRAEAPPKGTQPDAKIQVAALQPNQPPTEVTVPRDDVQNGSYTAWLVLDCEDKVAEGDETNNVANTAILVQGVVNDPPILESLSLPPSCHEGLPCTFVMKVADTTALPLKFQASNGPLGMSSRSDGVFTYVPPLGSARAGVTVTFGAMDQGGQGVTSAVTFDVLPPLAFEGTIGEPGTFSVGNDLSACPVHEVAGMGFAYVRGDENTVLFVGTDGAPTGANKSGAVFVPKVFNIPGLRLGCHLEAAPNGGFLALDIGGSNTVIRLAADGTLLGTAVLPSAVGKTTAYAEGFAFVGGTTFAFLDVGAQRLVLFDVATGKLDTAYGGNQGSKAGAGTPGVIELYADAAMYVYDAYLWTDGDVFRVHNRFFSDRGFADFASNGVRTASHAPNAPDGHALVPADPDAAVQPPWFLLAAPDGGVLVLDLLSNTLQWSDGPPTFAPHDGFALAPKGAPADAPLSPGVVHLDAYGLSGNNLTCAALTAGGFTCHNRDDERGYVIDQAGQLYRNCPTIDVSPPIDNLQFGGVSVGQKKTVTITIANQGGGVLHLADASIIIAPGASPNPTGVFSHPKPPGNTLLYPGDTYAIPVTFQPKQLGTYVASLELTTNACDVVLTIPLVGYSGAKLEAKPTSLTFASAEVGAPAKQHLTVRSIGSTALTLNSVKITGAQASAFAFEPPFVGPATLQPGASLGFDVRFLGTKAGDFSATLELASNDSSFSQVKVPLLARTRALVRPTPTGFGFANLEVGGTRTQSITLTNSGFTTLTLSPPVTEGSLAFALVDAPTGKTSLGPNATLTLTLRYAPTASGTQVGHVVLAHDDASRPPIRLVAIGGPGTELPNGFAGKLSFVEAFGANLEIDRLVLELSTGGFAAFDATTGAILVLQSDATPDAAFGDGGRIQVTGPSGAFPSAANVTAMIELRGGGFALLSKDGPTIYAVDPGGQPLEVVGKAGVIDVAAVHSGVGPDVRTLVQLTPPNEHLAFVDGETDNVYVVTTAGTIPVGAGTGGVIALAGAGSNLGTSVTGAGDSLMVTATNGYAFGDGNKKTLYAMTSGGQLLGQSPIGALLVEAGRLAPYVVAPNPPSLLFHDLAGHVTAFDGGTFGPTAMFQGATTLDFTLAFPSLVPGRSVIGLRSGAGVGVSDSACDCVWFLGNDGKPLTLSPKLTATPPASFDFGRVPVGQTSSEKSFEVANPGTYPLTLDVALASSQFRVLGLPESGRFTVLPGGSATIAVRFAPTAVGQHSATLAIATNDATTPSLVVAVSGSTGPHLTLVPDVSTLDIGLVGPAETRTRELVLGNDGADPLALTSVTLTGDPAIALTGGPANGTSIAPKSSGALKVTCAPTTTGVFAAYLTIVHDDPSQPTRYVALTCRRGGGLVVTPKAIACSGLVAGKTTHCGALSLQNDGSKPVVIGMAAGSTGVSVTGALPATLPPGGVPVVLSVYVTPGAAGVMTGTVDIAHDAVGMLGHTVVPVTATVHGAIDVSPAAIDFGAVPLGAAVDANVTITAPAADVTLLGFATTGSPMFTLPKALPTPAVLTAATTLSVTVRCAPKVSEDAKGALLIATGAPGQPIVTVPVACRAGPVFDVQPKGLHFVGAKKGETRMLPVVVSNLGSAPLGLGKPVVDGAEFSTPFQGGSVPPGGSVLIPVLFAPTADGNPLGTLHITPAVPASPLADLPLSGSVGTALALVGAHSPVDFGTRALGSTTLGAVSVLSLGSVPAVLDGATLAPATLIQSGNGFDLPTGSPQFPSGITLNPGEVYSLPVRFRPLSVGVYASTLTVTAGGAKAEVGLRGRGGGALVALPAFVDFGDVPVGTTASLPLALSNPGTGDALTVFALGDPAPFTVVGVPAKGAPLAAGASLPDVLVSFSPKAPGTWQRTLRFSSLVGAEDAVAEIVVTGRSGVSGRLLEPASGFLGFEAVSVGKAVTRPVRVASVGKAPLSIVGLELPSGWFTMEQAPVLPYALPGGTALDLQVTCKATEAGTRAGELRVHTDDVAHATLVVRLVCRTAPALAIEPKSLDFGAQAKLVPFTKSVTLRNNGASPLTIVAAASPALGKPVFTVDLALPKTLEPEATVTVPITFKAPAFGRYTAKLVVTSTDPVQSTLELPLSGVSGPRADVTPPFINYCQKKEARTITLKNVGSHALVLTDVALGPDAEGTVLIGFPGQKLGDPPPLPITLAPQQTTSFTATLTSVTAKDVGQATVVLTTSDPTTPTSTVRLAFGKGAAFPDGFNGTADLGAPGAASAYLDAVGIGTMGAAELCTGGLVHASPLTRSLYATVPGPGGSARAADELAVGGRLELVSSEAIGALGLEPTLSVDLGEHLVSLEDGTLMLTAPSLGALVFLDAEGHLATAYGNGGVIRLGPLVGAGAIAVTAVSHDGDKGFYIADRAGRQVVAVTKSGTLDAAFGPGGLSNLAAVQLTPGPLFGGSMALLPGGGLAVTDPTESRIVVFKSNGQLDPTWGTKGVVSVKAGAMAGLVAYEQGLVLADRAAGALRFLDSTGAPNTNVKGNSGPGVLTVTGLSGPFPGADTLGPSLITLRFSTSDVVNGTLVVAEPEEQDALFVEPAGTAASAAQKTGAELRIDCPIVMTNVNTAGAPESSLIKVDNVGDKVLSLTAPASFMSPTFTCGASAEACAVTPIGAPGTGVSSKGFTVKWSPPSGSAGCFEDAVTFTHDGINGPATTCPILVRTKAKLGIFPSGSYDFPPQAIGSAYTRDFAIRNDGCESLVLTKTQMSSGASPKEILMENPVIEGSPITIPPGGAYHLKVRCQPVDVGEIAGYELDVQATGLASLQVPLTCWGGAKLDATPEKLDWVNVAPAASELQNVTLTNLGGGLVELTKLAFADDPKGAFALVGAPALPRTLGIGESLALTVAFTPPIDGEYYGTTPARLLVTSTASPTELEVPLHGETGACVHFSPEPVDFGYVKVGAKKPLTLTASNCGAGLLSLQPSKASVDKSCFTLESFDSVAVPTGQSQSFKLTCAPTSTGTCEADLLFDTNASQANDDGQVALHLACKSGGCLAAAPLEVDFGTVDCTSESPTRSVVLTSTGSDDLTDVTLSIVAAGPASYFGLTPETGKPITVPAGDPKGVTITASFFPSNVPGLYEGAFQIVSEQASCLPEGGLVVKMSGRVGPCPLAPEPKAPPEGGGSDAGPSGDVTGADTTTVEGGGQAAEGTTLKPYEPLDGCSCQTAPRTEPPLPLGGALVLVLAALILWRRRARA